MERTDARPNIFPVGENYVFTVCEEPEKIKTASGKAVYSFKFEATVDGELRTYKERFFPWQCSDLLRALKCKEVKENVFEWEKPEVVGRIIVADIVHEQDRNNVGQFWPRLRNIRSEDALQKIKDEEHVPF